MASTTIRHRPSTIDLFAFPSDTTFRFILLIISVIGLSLYLYDLLYTGLYINLLIEQINRCAPFQHEVTALVRDSPQSNELSAAFTALFHCNAPYDLDRALWVMAALVGQMVVATVIYWLLPGWKVHREGLKLLSVAEHPQLVPALSELWQKAGVRRTPRFVWNPLSRTRGGLAFGRFGGYYVRLDGGLVNQFYTDQDRSTFDAVMLHELAHLRNADVDKTYFAVTTTIAFCLVAVAPYFLWMLRSVIIGSGSLSNSLFNLDMVLRTAILLTLVYLVLNAILRAREFFADVRAMRSGASATALDHVLMAGKNTPPNRWWAIWSLHPSAAARRRVLAEPHLLLHMGFWEAFATGLVASIAFKSASSFTETLRSGLEVGAPPRGLLAGIIFGPLAAGIVGSGVWRMTLAAANAHQRLRGLLWLALGLTLGVALGRMIAFEASSLLFSMLLPLENPLAFVGSRVLSFGLLLVGVLVLLHWIRDSAEAWLNITPARTVLLYAYASSLVIASGILAIWMSMLSQLDLLGASGLTLSDVGNLFWGSLLAFPVSITIPILVGFALLPLSTTFWVQKSGAFPTVSDVRRTLQPGLVVLASTSGGIAYTVLLFAFHAWLRRYGQQEGPMSQEFAFLLAQWSIARAMLMQVLVAATVAGLARHLPAALAVAAAVVTGCLITAGILLVNGLDGCIEVITLQPGTTCGVESMRSSGLFIFGKVASVGGLGALLAAVSVAALAERFRSPVRIGVLAGLVFCGVWLTTNIILSFAFSPTFSLLWGYVWLPLAGVCLLIVAALGTYGVRRRYVLNALVAAFVAACIGTLGLLGLEVSDNLFGKLQPDIVPVAYYDRGTAYLQKGEYDRAIADFNQALTLTPDDVDAYTKRGSAYFSKGEYDHAIADFNEALKRDPDYVNAYAGRAVSYRNKGEYDRAIADYDEVLKRNPDFDEVYAARALAYMNKGEYDRAIADYDQVLKRNPDDVDARLRRGTAYMNKGEYDQAIADYDQVLTLQPNSAATYNERGWAYAQQGEYDRAIADSTRAIQLQPDFAAAYDTRAFAHAGKGASDQAITDYTQALQFQPDYVLSYLQRGKVYAQIGERAKAMSDFKKVLALSDDPRLRNQAEEQLQALGAK